MGTRKNNRKSTKYKKNFRKTRSKRQRGGYETDDEEQGLCGPCSICLEPMNNVNNLIATDCNHTFHKDCLRNVCSRTPINPPCPICRGDISDTCRQLGLAPVPAPEPVPVPAPPVNQPGNFIYLSERDTEEMVERIRNGNFDNLQYMDLGGVDLEGVDLEDVDLEGVNLENANLTGIDLRTANLHYAHLPNADLSLAELLGANLQDVDLTNANLTGANLTGANLTYANLEGANLTHANLEGANLTNANINMTIFHFANTQGANFQGTGFEGDEGQMDSETESEQESLASTESEPEPRPIGGKRKTRKSKKSKKSKRKGRKTRSKRQRGGNSEAQEEKDKYLFDAIDIYDYDKVENALNNGANVNARNKDGDTPLIHAIKLEDIDMVYLLLEDPNINIELDVKKNKELRLAEELTPDGEEQNGIPYAIEDYIETKNKIKKQKDDNIKELSNYKRPNISSLKTMAYYQGPSALDTHINLNPGTIKRPYGKLGGKRKTKKSKKRFRKTRSKKQRGGTVADSYLIRASAYGHIDMVKKYIEDGADVNAKNDDGNTALMMASWNGHIEVVRFLLKNGADVNAKNNDDNTALQTASMNGRTETVAMLLNNGADVNMKDEEGTTALGAASEAGETEVVKLLLKNGADVNVIDDNEYTALDWAVEFGHTEVVRLLEKAIETEQETRSNKQIAMELVRDRVPNIPSLRTMSHRQLPTYTTTEIKDYDMLPPSQLGGKRKSKRKSKKSKRKTRKTRRK
jgi:ankyrin repeat protein